MRRSVRQWVADMGDTNTVEQGVEDVLIGLLETFKFPVFRQGSVTESYPDDFFTYWETEEDGNSFYDNKTVDVAYLFNVYFYSVNPANTYTYIHQARNLLKQNGWTIRDRGYDVDSGEQTHTGRGFDVAYLKHEID